MNGAACDQASGLCVLCVPCVVVLFPVVEGPCKRYVMVRQGHGHGHGHGMIICTYVRPQLPPGAADGLYPDIDEMKLCHNVDLQTAELFANIHGLRGHDHDFTTLGGDDLVSQCMRFPSIVGCMHTCVMCQTWESFGIFWA